MGSSAVILLVCLLGTLNPIQCQDEEALSENSVEGSSSIDNVPEDEEYTVSALIERANKDAGQALDDPEIVDGDIAVDRGLQNADRCTSRRFFGCKWPRKKKSLFVYVPYVISNQYSSREKAVILKAMESFAQVSCIRFRPRRRGLFFKERSYLDIQSSTGCWSYIGRRGGKQTVSLRRRGCVYHQVIQHELLHALGFHHEQTRSDRDLHVRILYENVIPSQRHNFDKVKTKNLGTPYDYGSVMHYSRYAFSRNRKPTIVPIPDANVAIGRAKEMSKWDIERINRLYCNRRTYTGVTY